MPRKYTQRVRAEMAEATRNRVLDALYQRLRESPTAPTSVDDVAKAAGVARSTVYLVFGSRAGLFDALSARLLVGGGYDQLVQAQRQPDARRHMSEAITGSTHMFAAHRDVFHVLFALARLDPEAVGGTVHRAERQRAAGIGRLARRLAEQGRLRKGMTAREANDVIWMLGGFEAFDALYTDRGLSADDTARSLVETAERAVLVRPSARRTSSPGTR